MEQVLREYGTSSNNWIFLALGGFILLSGMIFLIVIAKRKDGWRKNQTDLFRYTSWGCLLLGAMIGVYGLLNGEMTNSQDDSMMRNWTSERGYYVDNFGKVEDRPEENIIQVRTGSSVAEKEVDHVIKGCDERVYAEFTNEEVWLCEEK